MTSHQQQAATATITTPTEREIRIERIFEAPRDRVFAVFTDPELIPEWWGLRDSTTIVDKMDVRAGGDWRFISRGSDGSETAFRGSYREISPPERVVQTFEWEGMPGYVALETATFEDLGERTKLVTTSLFYTTEERDGMLGSGMEYGVNETYARLDELLARLASD
ncbi:MAG: SRPBCC family protein [Solirubrobacteraceae bacterium]|nr:SRPBCC family protein [Solirubrobacteraceae bacterium]